MKPRTALAISLLLLIGMAGLVTACQPTLFNDVAEEDIVATRQPLPEPTPGVVEQEIIETAEAAGLTGWSLLGLTAEEWINLGISLLIVLAGYVIGVWLLRWLYGWVARRVAPGIGQEVQEAVGTQLRWLVLIVALHLATARLILLGDLLKRTLLDIYFVIGMILLAVVLWRAIDLAASYYRQRIGDQERLAELEPAALLLIRMARVFLIVAFGSILLAHFGINVSALAAAVGLLGLALSLAARDTIADAIAGILILVDRPFRVGDRIEIEEANTWGDVVDIGLRTTRILTRDNRLVIVPNSIIGSNQVINYTYPDPNYRIETHVKVAYGSEIEHVRQVMVDTVRQVEGVLAEKGVDALYVEMGDSAMIFRVRWWIETYADTRRMFDKVHTALQKALDQNGIVCPYPIQTVVIQQEMPSGQNGV